MSLLKIIPLVLMAVMLSSSGFQPVSSGEIIWLSENSVGEYVLVSYSHSPYFDYLITTYYYNENIYSSNDILDGVPDKISVSGCGHHLVQAASINDTIYVNRIEVPNNIVCGNISTVYIPIITK